VFIRSIITSFVVVAFGVQSVGAVGPDVQHWDQVVKAARHQTVYWHAWGGEPRINDYIAWAGRQLTRDYGVKLVHVKVNNTANVVAKVLAEKAAGKTTGGSVDLIWINGANFAAMKRQGLLMTNAWADKLPNFAHVDVAGKPTVINDFTIPTDGLEAPWGMAQLVFMYDSLNVKSTPKSIAALLHWARANPGRFTYPQPPEFHGTTFLKQALYELAGKPSVLSEPAARHDFAAVTKPLFDYLDKLHPQLWRGGRAFPQNSSALRNLLADGELDIAFAFNPAAASNAIANSELPATVRTFVFDGGTIGNTHFVTIPFNANARAGAMVVANFLMSPRAQAAKQDPEIWGDPTVLAINRLNAEDKARFAKLDLGIATLRPEQLGLALPEPHPSWMRQLEKAWDARYGAN
jgi:putative thiamine transport system substrate-binding protein